jgi:hypothetical protein
MDFLHCVLSLRVDRRAGKKLVGIGLRDLQHVVVADEKLRMLSVKQAGLVVEPVHAEEYGFLDISGGP